jgi:hypothetical protein
VHLGTRRQDDRRVDTAGTPGTFGLTTTPYEIVHAPFTANELFAVAALALLMVIAPRGASAASCAGMSHALQLSDGRASPPSGVAGSTFTFSVTYRDNANCSPDSVHVLIDGLGAIPMSYVGGSLVNGATFQAKVDLPAGRRSYSFAATSGSGTGVRTAKLKGVVPSQVAVSPPATPKPRPKPPVPEPTQRPPRPSPTPVPTQTPRPTHQPSPQVTAAPSPTPEAAYVPMRPLRDDDDHFIGGGPGGLPAVTATVGGGGPPLPWLVLLVSSVGAFVGLLVFAALSARFADPAPEQAPALGSRLPR